MDHWKALDSHYNVPSSLFSVRPCPTKIQSFEIVKFKIKPAGDLRLLICKTIAAGMLSCEGLGGAGSQSQI